MHTHVRVPVHVLRDHASAWQLASSGSIALGTTMFVLLLLLVPFDNLVLGCTALQLGSGSGDLRFNGLIPSEGLRTKRGSLTQTKSRVTQVEAQPVTPFTYSLVFDGL